MSTTSTPRTHPVTRLPNGEREAHPRGIPGLPVWQATVGAVGASAITWSVLGPLAGLDLVVRTGTGTREVGLGSVVVTALVVSLGALVVAGGARRFAARPRAAFLGTSAGVLLLSLLGPVASATTVGAALALALLHVVVASTVVPVIGGRLPARRG